MDQVTISVKSERGTYPVVIAPGATKRLTDLLTQAGVGPQRLVVSASPIWRIHGERLGGALNKNERPALIPDGERAKNLTTVARIYDACVKRHLDRSAAVIAFGGGVVGDVAGFAAASYLRGL